MIRRILQIVVAVVALLALLMLYAYCISDDVDAAVDQMLEEQHEKRR